jgi:hypothetical protein
VKTTKIDICSTAAGSQPGLRQVKEEREKRKEERERPSKSRD